MFNHGSLARGDKDAVAGLGNETSDMVVTVSEPAAPSGSASARLVADLEALLAYYEERGLEGEALVPAEAKFILAVARYRLAPPVGKMIAERAHVMVFGGAGAGKSTAANILVGAGVADVNAQAGYTRHPVAYFRSDLGRVDELWPKRLGSLARHDGTEAASSDRDIYGWQKIEGDLADPGFLRRHVVWDCPDLTTKDAVYYQTRVIEIAGLADVGVYVASDERYNDELPTNFLQGVLEGGKWVVVVLTKVAPIDADQLIALFRDQVAARLKHKDRILTILAAPSPPPERFNDLWTDAFPYGAQMREAVEQATGDLNACRRAAKRLATQYLRDRQSRLLDPARKDLGEWRAWAELVRQRSNEMVLRFEREHLGREEIRQFQEALARLKQIFALPGYFRYLWQGLELLRTPYRMLKSFVRRWTPAPGGGSRDDDRALDELRREMLESLRVATATRKNRHALWREIHDAMDEDVPAMINPLYQKTRDRQRRELEQRLASLSRAIPERIEQNQVITLAIRVARTLIDLAGLWFAYWITENHLGGVGPLTFVFALLFVGVSDDLVEWLCRQYVHRHREGVTHQQKEHVRELVRTACIDPLLSLPPGRGRRLLELAELVDRLPKSIAAVQAAAVKEEEATR